MRLRLILLVLSLLAVLSAAAGGFFYYTSLQEASFHEAERQAAARLQMISRNLSSLLSGNVRPVRTLAGMEEICQAVAHPTSENLALADLHLDHFMTTLGAEVCYILNREGTTLASSNRAATDSFVGQNFSFRPYFKEAIVGNPATYLALGTTSNRRGVYHSFPVYELGGDSIVGIAVIKASIELIEKELGLFWDEIVLVTGPQGVVFISNRSDWLYRTVWESAGGGKLDIAASRQFGSGPWDWVGLAEVRDDLAQDHTGKTFLMHRTELDNYSGWEVIHLRAMEDITRIAVKPFVRVVRPVILILCVLIGISVFVLYRKASREIIRRKTAEEALRESDNRYRSLYNNTPALLHSIDTDGKLLSVSNHWCEVMGFQRDEVLGRPVTDFFTEESRCHAEDIVIPVFFRQGFCADVAYQFVKKNGEIMDVLLSAYGDRDDDGGIVRSLAVSVDVTERNRAVAALKKAKEELSEYSRDLERQVTIRTREITNIIKYTPDVVYVKDREGCYILVNSRFEELFGVKNEEIRGKTDYEIFPNSVADQFRCSDQQVLEEDTPCRVEETVPHGDGEHTYLAVKFPVYDEAGVPSGVCGIATDITAVKKAQDQLRRLSGRIIESQERERGAIARELHDELGQVLTALRIDAAWLAKHLEEDKKGMGRARAMCDLIDTSIGEVRGLATRLRPGVLDDLGLVDALDWYCADFERRSSISCVFEHNEIPELEEAVATAAYRIAQEAMTNVVRHAEASRVEVELAHNEGELFLWINDDGEGFNEADLAEAEGLGVAGMRERAALAGGRLEVITMPGQGTRIGMRVMMNSQENREDV